MALLCYPLMRDYFSPIYSCVNGNITTSALSALHLNFCPSESWSHTHTYKSPKQTFHIPVYMGRGVFVIIVGDHVARRRSNVDSFTPMCWLCN
jgi:hypothetical protein